MSDFMDQVDDNLRNPRTGVGGGPFSENVHALKARLKDAKTHDEHDAIVNAAMSVAQSVEEVRTYAQMASFYEDDQGSYSYGMPAVECAPEELDVVRDQTRALFLKRQGGGQQTPQAGTTADMRQRLNGGLTGGSPDVQVG